MTTPSHCKHCGAPLRFEAAVDRVDCSFCGTTNFVHGSPAKPASSAQQVAVEQEVAEAGTLPARRNNWVLWTIFFSLLVLAATVLSLISSPISETHKFEVDPINGCGCNLQVDGSSRSASLALRLYTSKSGKGYRASWVLSLSGLAPVTLPGDEIGLPAEVAGQKILLRMGCSGSTVTFASGARVGGYNVEDKTVAWSAKLPKPIQGSTTAFPGDENTLSTTCSSTEDKRFGIYLEGGEYKLFESKTGKLIKL